MVKNYITHIIDFLEMINEGEGNTIMMTEMTKKKFDDLKKDEDLSLHIDVDKFDAIIQKLKDFDKLVRWF